MHFIPLNQSRSAPESGGRFLPSPHEPCSADILVRGFTGHSCPVSVKPNWTLPPCRLATGKSPEPADRNVCATAIPVGGFKPRRLVSGKSCQEPAVPLPKLLIHAFHAW